MSAQIAAVEERPVDAQTSRVYTDPVCGAPDYRVATHADLPHIVKFSGGRSSGAMVLGLARSGVLRIERGDAVLFANTTAEHPATYDFVTDVCDELESEHGVPCFWYEYCTVERLGPFGYSRRSAYRLVKRRPYEKTDPADALGYRSDGTAFEEMVSARAMLPDRHFRICTHMLKIRPGAMLISEWLGGGPGPAHRGHHHGTALVNADELADRYRGSKLTRGQYRDRIAYVASRPPARPEQNWQDFTKVDLQRPSSGPRPEADIWGAIGRPREYVTLLGLRADEPERVDRMLFKNVVAEGATKSRCRDSSQPAGEFGYAPLADHSATNDDVMCFWRSQPYDLGIDSAFGNCVFCFMKGPVAISRLAHSEDPQRVPSTPSDVAWWADIERRYARPADTTDGRSLGFFDLTRPTFSEIAAGPIRVGRRPSIDRPCACTD